MASLFELLKAVKPRRVLLTTYSFSPEWFEATVYPLLTKQGCEQISVMLDNREARSSIKASVSRYGGNRYRIMSVLPRSKDASDGERRGGGIFHPKIAYLETEDDDIALVASGNLTAAGQGHQMEVLDAVKASLEPEVFGELSKFFQDLPGRLSLLSPEDTQILAAFGERAAQQASHHRRQTGTRTAWLITTLRATAGEQFAMLARQQQLAPDALTVLSPFHDEDVAAVTRLRKKLGVERLRLALGKSPEVRGKEDKDSFIAPFADKVKPKKGELEFVTPTLGRNERPRKIHAKWFELDSREEGSLMLTGSVNATPQSLWSLNNIEVSLARRLPAPIAGKWPQARGNFVYRPCVYPVPDAPVDTLNCSARIVGKSDRLTLEVRFSSTAPENSVHAQLWQEEGETLFESDAHVGTDDTAEISLKSALRKKLDERALWLTVSSGDSSATVWANVEVELARRPGDYDFHKAIEHFDADDSDEHLNLLFATAFLDILGRVDGSSNPKPSNPPKLPPKKRKVAPRLSTDDGDIVITGQEWLDSVRAKKTPTAVASSVMAQLSRAIARLIKTLDTPLTEPEKEPPEDEEDDDEDDVTGENGDQNGTDSGVEEADEENAGDPIEARAEALRQKALAKRRKLRVRLEKRMQSIMTQVDKLLGRSGGSAVPDELMVKLLPIKLNYELSGSRLSPCGRTPPINPAKELLKLRRFSLGSPVREQLCPLFACAGVVIAAAYTCPEQSTLYGEIRSHLEGLGGAILTHAELSQWVEDGVRDQQLVALSKFTPEVLAQVVAGIAAAKPLEQRLADLVLDALTAPPGAQAPSDCTPVEKAMFETLRLRAREGRKPLFSVTIGDMRVEDIGCPKCFQGLKESNTLLRNQMLVKHLNCDQPLFLRKTAYADVTFEQEDREYVKNLEGAPFFKTPPEQRGPQLDGAGSVTRNATTPDN
ncbi:hypothetical protein [Burkholderia ambifaria]|uniref:hypothetical protein n=1 Tax=Burkholderia ambifaria TaxID=152480 RepID=UPI00158F404E|nr:hypothetical protein [Burkholderia ambifaria]